ncbi:MAG: phage tail sheath C-terminal domain-containing protein [Bacteroidia bacterium]
MTYKTPGVYLRDNSPPQPAVPSIETALPAFIGYTEYPGPEGYFQPFRIRDLAHYESVFGSVFRPQAYYVEVASDGQTIIGAVPEKRFYLYDSLQMYFENGGGDCYIVSVGNYESIISLGDGQENHLSGLWGGITALNAVSEPTLILFPDAVAISDKVELGQLQMAALAHCARVKNRFLIADLSDTTSASEVDEFREYLGNENLIHGAAYFPWIFTRFDQRFHFFELKFRIREGDRLTPVSDYSVFSADVSSDAAAQHRELVRKVLETGESVSAILKTLGDNGVDRYHSPESRWRSLFEAILVPTDEARKELLAHALHWLAEAAMILPRLETILPEPLGEYIFVRKSNQELVFGIEKLIGLFKSAAIYDHLYPSHNPDEVNEIFSDLDQTNWIRASVVAHIPEFADWAAGEADGEVPFLTSVVKHLGLVASPILQTLQGLLGQALSEEQKAESALFTQHPFFSRVFEVLSLHLKRLPPSGAVAGVIVRTDANRGVWKAPANEPIAASLGPCIAIDDKDQESLNVHPTGKSINAIRAIRGRGTRIWGGRTLAGNSNEWRYVSVRRYFNYVEEFVRRSSEQLVFEPNDANTWMHLRLILDNFLRQQWRLGALSGASVEEAYYVAIGLGETMTGQDILEGRMIAEIGIAAVRPAEFIVIQYTCRMETS